MRDANDAVYVHDFDGKISDWNYGAEHLFGYSESEALALHAERLIPPNIAELLSQHIPEKKHKGAERLVLCRRGNLLGDCEMAEEILNSLRR